MRDDGRDPAVGSSRTSIGVRMAITEDNAHRTSFAVAERGRRNILIPVQVEQCHHFVDTFEHGGRVKSERGRPNAISSLVLEQKI